MIDEDYVAMRNEIRRLHDVCRWYREEIETKDQQIERLESTVEQFQLKCNELWLNGNIALDTIKKNASKLAKEFKTTPVFPDISLETLLDLDQIKIEP